MITSRAGLQLRFKISLIGLSLLLGTSLLAAILVEPQIDVQQALQAPSFRHFFGTDALGRDLFLRVLEASRVSLFIGIFTTLLSFVVAFFVCLFALFGPAWLDVVIMRAVEVCMALPSLVLISVAMLFCNALFLPETPMAKVLVISLALISTSWFSLARQIRSMLEVEKNKLHIESARALGAHPVRIYFRHLLPGLRVPILVLMGLQIPNQLLFESFLTFVGIGLQPPTASWGVLIQDGWKTLSSFPHLILAPSGVLFLTVLSFNLIFDELRELGAPQLRR